MVYNGCDYEYATQVTAEHKVNTKSGGKIVPKWVQKSSHADNHFLDAEVYCMAAADILGVRSLHLQEIEEVKESKSEEQHTPEEEWIKKHENWI